MIENSATWVYVVKSNSKEHAIKIGITGQLKRRLNALHASTPFGVVGILTYEMDSRDYALHLESYLHEEFRKNRLHHEWFHDLDKSHILEKLSSYWKEFDMNKRKETRRICFT